MKICSRCKQNKQLSEFYKDQSKNDGLRSHCKLCKSKYLKLYYQTERGKAAIKRGRNKTRNLAENKRYLQTKKGKATRKIYTKKYYKAHPERYRAIKAVARAIKSGELIPAKYFLCYAESCFNQAQEYHHYKGYAPEHWLDVDPMCKKCHRKLTTYKKAVPVKPCLCKERIRENGYVIYRQM